MKVCKDCIYFEGYDEVMDDFTCFFNSSQCELNGSCGNWDNGVD